MRCGVDSVPDKHIEYLGDELEIFQAAVNWKRYLASRIRSFVNGDVVEVGAGLGANVNYFYRNDLTSWVSLEPDRRLCEEFRGRQSEGTIPAVCDLVNGTFNALSPDRFFDTILYIDVLEHIENDKAEFDHAFRRLNAGGHLVILCPAHRFLFSPFDKAIGHFRRYNIRMYKQLSDHKPLKIEYLDSVGMCASIANKVLLRQRYPNENQIAFWDRLLVPLSSLLDTLSFRLVGKSILGIWRR